MTIIFKLHRNHSCFCLEPHSAVSVLNDNNVESESDSEVIDTTLNLTSIVIIHKDQYKSYKS